MIITTSGILRLKPYGAAIRIPAQPLKLLYTAFCLTTPFTNFTIPFLLPKIKGFWIRYERTQK